MKLNQTKYKQAMDMFKKANYILRNQPNAIREVQKNIQLCDKRNAEQQRNLQQQSNQQQQDTTNNLDHKLNQFQYQHHNHYAAPPTISNTVHPFKPSANTLSFQLHERQTEQQRAERPPKTMTFSIQQTSPAPLQNNGNNNNNNKTQQNKGGKSNNNTRKNKKNNNKGNKKGKGKGKKHKK